MKLSISMTRRERLLGWSYLLICMFVLPIALNFLNGLLKNPLSDTEVNLVFFGINFTAIIVIFHGFLYASLLQAKENLWKCLIAAIQGFLIHRAGIILFTVITSKLCPDFSNANDENIIGMFQEHSALFGLATILLAPVYEELLYRGLLFQEFQRKNRLLAYALSAGVFSAIHVIGYIGLYDPLSLVLCFAQYLPAGIALAWAYEKSDTIVTPITMHIILNTIGVAVLR